ncbi:hypothetical protein BDZ89DRAFT_1041098 [Hymenopellis radicata]|nr:hypothetical protein BDZ89DRAFT_1041098 [Hymenopellis radicata]
MPTLFMPKKDRRTGKIIRGPTVPGKPVDTITQKARQLDRRAVQLTEEYEKQGTPLYTILHSNAVLTRADKGVVAQAFTIIDDTLNAFNDLPSCYLESAGDGPLARLEKTRDALCSILCGLNWAHLPKTALLVVFEMMATDAGMVYDLFGKRPQYTLALVCKAWHDTILECPAMWSKIRIRNFEPRPDSIKVFRFSGALFKAFEEVVNRSKRHELCLGINIPKLATDSTLMKEKTSDPGPAYWAEKHIFLLVKQASRWARVTILCRPSLMACLCVLRAPRLRSLRQLSLALKPIPGEVCTDVYTVQEISKALDPKRCKIVLQGFEVLSREAKLITDEKRRFLTVQDGALLDPFNLPSLRVVTINSKLSSATADLIADSTITSVAVLLARSKCTTKITMLTLTNAVFSETLLDLLHSLTNLSELQVRAVGRGSWDLKLVKLRTMLKDGKKVVKLDNTEEREQTLVNLVRLVFAIDAGQTHASGYEFFFGTGFNDMLKKRSAKKLEVLRLSPSTRKLVLDKCWQEMSGMKGISIRVQEPSI